MTTISGTNEIYRKLSSQIETQFPEFIRSEGPKFVAFLKAYFEYLEQTGKALETTRALPDTFDIDRTVDDFVEYFQREFLINIPREVVADKRLMAKYIRQFYRTRGSQESYRFLFRALFNEDIDFYYPGDDILRASDGRWVKETVIRGVWGTGDPTEMDGRAITGAASGATARVQEIIRIEAAGLLLYQLTIENVTGTFEEDELVQDGYGNSIRIFNAVGSVDNVLPVKAGGKHQRGDAITLAGAGGGSAVGTVASTTDISGVTFTIRNGGSGYRANGNTVFTISGGSPDYVAVIRIINISNTQVISGINTNIIQPLQNVVLNTNPFGAGGSMATKNINSTLQASLAFANATVGSINTIAVMDVGSGYTGSLPTVVVEDTDIYSQRIADAERGGYKGRNAEIIASRATGAIATVSITSSDANFLKNDQVTVTNTTRQNDANTTVTNTDLYGGITRGTRMLGIYPAIVSAQILGTFNLPGRYTDTKGMLSWNNKLQDNDFYQEFSYAIKTHKLLMDYASVVKELVHPAGTKLFGIVQNETGIDMNALSNTGSTVIKWMLANNVVKITGSNNIMTLTTGAFWFSNGVLKANSGAISVGGRGSNIFFVPVAPAGANGLYQVNAISSTKALTFRRKNDAGATTNGQFYYARSYLGNI